MYANLGALFLESGSAAVSLRYSRSSVDLFEQFRDRRNAALVLRNIAHAQWRQRDVAAAAQAMEEALERLPRDHPAYAEFEHEHRRLVRRLRRRGIRDWLFDKLRARASS